METIYIKSYYSDDNCSLDGIYKVTIPDNFSSDHKKTISEVGQILDMFKNEEIENPGDIDFEESFLPESFVSKIWNNIVENADSGTSLEIILQILDWEYEKIVISEEFDADYNTFE